MIIRKERLGRSKKVRGKKNLAKKYGVKYGETKLVGTEEFGPAMQSRRQGLRTEAFRLGPTGSRARYAEKQESKHRVKITRAKRKKAEDYLSRKKKTKK